jgi:hypothetical protein
MENKPKPCPFCGNTKLAVTPKNQFYEVQGEYGDAAISIRCWECSVDMYEHSRTERTYEKRVELLIDKWNRRVDYEQ